MATLSEYFDSEARDRLLELERALARDQRPDHEAMHRAVRALRGVAQMAREERVFRAASTLEAASRSLVAGAMDWSDDVAQRVRQTLTDLRSLVERSSDDGELEDRAGATVDRWAAVGIRAGGPAASVADYASGAFRDFAAREVAAIAEALDSGVQQLGAEPMDREPLRTILRRQRALLGATRLDEIPVVAEILRAVEDLTRVIAKLDVGVKEEWLDIYRVAREGLRASVEPLQQNRDPQPTNSLSRLRHMREELLERYGTGEAVSSAHESGGLVQAAPMDEEPEPVALTQAPAEPTPEPEQDPPVSGVHGDEEPPEEVLLLEDALPDAADADAAATGADSAEPAGEEEEGEEEEEGLDLLAAATGAMQRAAAMAAPAAAAVAAVAEGVAEAVSDAADNASGAAESPEEVAVPIEDLCFRGDAAVARAQELRGIIDRVAGHDPQARDAVEELYDLIRLARA